jgi:chemotaxis protein CheC
MTLPLASGEPIMTDMLDASPSRLELLRPLFASATRDASAAMCRWTDGLVTLTLDEIREIPMEDVCSALSLGDEPLTMVVLSLAGDIGGEMILAFDNANGRRLAASLLGAVPGDSLEWCELEKSALRETGNILGCAYMNALTRLIDVELMPSPPCFVQDYGASVFQQALLAQAMTRDRLLVCRTGFHRDGEELSWRVLFVPTDGMRVAMEKALRGGPCPRRPLV